MDRRRFLSLAATGAAWPVAARALPRAPGLRRLNLVNPHTGVIDFLADLLAAVGTGKATILSAYRTRETNDLLARTIFGVAENSQHIYARALDITLDSKLAEAMQAARAMQRGGVGWYPRSNFIHIDSGPVRN